MSSDVIYWLEPWMTASIFGLLWKSKLIADLTHTPAATVTDSQINTRAHFCCLPLLTDSLTVTPSLCLRLQTLKDKVSASYLFHIVILSICDPVLCEESIVESLTVFSSVDQNHFFPLSSNDRLFRFSFTCRNIGYLMYIVVVKRF